MILIRSSSFAGKSLDLYSLGHTNLEVPSSNHSVIGILILNILLKTKGSDYFLPFFFNFSFLKILTSFLPSSCLIVIDFEIIQNQPNQCNNNQSFWIVVLERKKKKLFGLWVGITIPYKPHKIVTFQYLKWEKAYFVNCDGRVETTHCYNYLRINKNLLVMLHTFKN